MSVSDFVPSLLKVKYASFWTKSWQLLDRPDSGEKLLAHHLDGLAVLRKLSTFGFALQLISARPAQALASRDPVTLDTVHPDAGRFHLRGFQVRSRPPIEILESIDAHRLHFYCSSQVEPTAEDCEQVFPPSHPFISGTALSSQSPARGVATQTILFTPVFLLMASHVGMQRH